jgi:hypothetical protein
MDWRGKLMSVALGLQQQSSNTNMNSQVKIIWQDRLINFISVARDQSPSQDNLNFKTKVAMKQMENGPVPDTAAFI